MESWMPASKRVTTWLIGAALLFCQTALAADAAATPGAAPAVAAPSLINAELMQSIRAATFEVVLKKPEADPVQYEKPLPLELIPFAERNDKYESIGTAFAIAPGTFVTAAHVTNAASGSMWGVPALRDAAGHIYPIDKVTRFSYHEDFIVFTVTGAPPVTPLPTSTEYHFDTPVIAVGNALGQGIVGRDGTLTSETPEDQDGRWKWLRFSAPASPGNSGGPLLDARGRVIGLISRKSANENLNFALPIALVLNASTSGGMDLRYTVGVPVMSARKTVQLTANFDLPQSFVEFDRKLIATLDQQLDAARAALLQESAGSTYPRGKASRLLADTLLGQNPGLVTQQADGSWDVLRTANAGNTTQVGNDGVVWVNSQAGTPLFHIHYPGDMDITKARGDGKLLADLLLKNLRLTRTIGSESIRITSVGDGGKPQESRDGDGRVWLQWRYPMPSADATLIIDALPVPDGYVGMIRSAKGYNRETNSAELKVLMNFMETPYSGTLPQWRAFLADTHLRPDSFGKWKAALDPAGEVTLDLPRLGMKLDKSVLNVTDRSLLNIFPGMLMDGDRPAWDVLALQLRIEPRSGAAQIGAIRRAQPAPDAGQEALTRWQNVTQLTGQFAGKPMRDANGFWTHRTISADGKTLGESTSVYQLTYYTTKVEVQGEVPRAGGLLPQMFHVNEK